MRPPVPAERLIQDEILTLEARARSLEGLLNILDENRASLTPTKYVDERDELEVRLKKVHKRLAELRTQPA